MEYPVTFMDTQKQKYPQIVPLSLAMTPQKTFEYVYNAAQKQVRWEITSVDSKKLKLEIVATTFFFRFKDDVVIEIRPVGSESKVHMRSKSRLGKDDFGANADRISRFFDFLKK
jgi:uncharacterized protein (DUF1499 family)